MKTIIQFIIKELLQLKRDKKMLAVVFMAPILQLILLGYAANMDVNIVHTTILDQDKTATSREFIKNFEESGYFSIDYYASNYEELTKLIDDGKTLVGIVIPNDFEKKLNRRESVSLQTLFEGSDGNKSSISLGYIQGITNRFSQKIVMDTKDKYGIKIPIVGSLIPEVRVWYNPEMKTRNYMVPGIMGLILMITTLSLMSMAVVREKEIGTLEQLIVTPLKPYQLLLGKLIPYTLVGFVVLVIVMILMTQWFGIVVRGNRLFLLFTALLFVLSNLGLGLFISTVSKTQQQAMMASVFAVMMPMIYLSGFAFPIENMPEIVQYITYLIPLRYFITILRGIVLKGVGFSSLWVETLILFGMGAGILIISSLRFSKKIE
ncbi:MAG: ABC transporter [Ignavibacteria bacterium RIFOXYC2_FULL_35_16]|nr:MAG: ABC transporter [Ignavibacteria bacterium GWA2_36_19]OGU53035.1 MAG: ABC transporter [Ignavibacteria bacterium GWC2_35_8]OGU62179.1 MAG: ABC transporter [Ignavibacteria bacterium GWF2_35_20]OGU82216.1 MAG: ABC transporter [Ignavibacteria bacterium RIFOXYA2_FULL_35_9]OGU84585.1 MAG: ABC transporter [Ignavibacteria bacterium RIFOXYA12_FULL_35_25]OGU96855.1 MAG: ABC transporter [Ignavibacteria bacterium RIFOXYB12_FULL_35_14]OGV01307.1 MAG: ABC transporter [Ignavibacteria bacterium RIFOXY